MSIISKTNSLRDKVLLLMSFILLAILIDLLLIYLIPEYFKVPIKFSNIRKVPKIDPLYFKIGIVLFSPLAEELVFRSILVINSKNIKLWISSILGIIVYIFFFKSGYIVAFTLLGISFSISYLLLNKMKEIEVNPRYTGKKFTYILLILSSMLFALAHFKFNLDNYDLRYILRLVDFILIAFMLGIIRIKCGLRWSIIMHSFKNLYCIFLPSLYFLIFR